MLSITVTLALLSLGALAAPAPQAQNDAHQDQFYLGPITFLPLENRMSFAAIDNLYPPGYQPALYPCNISFPQNSFNGSQISQAVGTGEDFAINSWPQGDYVACGNASYSSTYTTNVKPVPDSSAFQLTIYHAASFQGAPPVLRYISVAVPALVNWMGAPQVQNTYIWNSNSLYMNASEEPAPKGWVGTEYNFANPN